MKINSTSPSKREYFWDGGVILKVDLEGGSQTWVKKIQEGKWVMAK